MDGQRFHVFVMKEPDYVMNLMSSYGTTNWYQTQKQIVSTKVKMVSSLKNNFIIANLLQIILNVVIWLMTTITTVCNHCLLKQLGAPKIGSIALLLFV